ncbi:NADP oxidoreductase coenzyme F420-dependent [Arenibacter nanhaiticus]|uniref:NADP oxidoreductase coenzyme F420-dependent n=1 Tax=Arenibacter nanhaiticus TaxID=558155 RepID=A0A1M6L4E2_9FLAO|nr:DUF2520 domain-containing protein [Arenibacter nanhaiticus]SHJ65984.1 NADP oxidoreductase coenzyme F420-dependent [Arenibacter nanhaiticus]
MISIVILGSGNVAEHLLDTFLQFDTIVVKQLIGRSETSISSFTNKTVTSIGYDAIEEADVYIIAVSDDAIAEVAEKLAQKQGLVVHTSGSVPMQGLHPKNRRGVFYPLQTFSPGKKIDFKSVPICIEAENQKDITLLQQLAAIISDKVFEISSEQRKSIHLAAVFVNNFTNHLFHIGQQVCQENEVPFEVLLPLIKETVQKLEQLSPYDAQTGPARRNDSNTLERHQNQLNKNIYKDIYSLLSKSIKETYGQKL